MFRRPFRRGAMRRGMLKPDVPPLLRKAHQMMANGNYTAAAEAFEQLGRAGEARQHPKAGDMFLQGGRARLMAGQTPAGIADLKQGLTLLTAMGMTERAAQVAQRAQAELNQRGLSAEAQELSSWAKSSGAPSSAGSVAMSAPVKKPLLPTSCPECGGPLRADDVDWIDEVTAECNWCGTGLRGEPS